MGRLSILQGTEGLLHPSLQHRAAVGLIRMTRRRSDTVDDPEAYRRRYPLDNAREPSRIPSGFTPLDDTAFPVLEYRPGQLVSTRTLVHLHGGAYVNPADHRVFGFVKRLADELGARALMPLYPLAPEHTWRDSRGELVDLVGSLSDVVLSGESAGGGYALSVAEGVRDAGGTMPSRMVLISPWVDLGADVPGRSEAETGDPWLREDLLGLYAEWWAGSEADRARPEVSPGRGDLSGLPPTLTLCGTRELLHPENRALAARARDAGWETRLVIGEGLIHVYPLLPIPEAHAAFRQIVTFLG